MNQQTEWVILEAMGHIKVAGRYFVENGLHRVDIPDPSDPNLFRTEWYGNAAIFRITPVDELTARHVAKQSVIPDAIPWDAMRYIKQLAAPQETIEGTRRDYPGQESEKWVDEPDPTVYYEDELMGEDEDDYDPKRDQSHF